MHRKNKKLPIWMLIAFSAIAIFSTAISSFAWFTLIAPPSSSMVTGSSEVDIESVTALKVQETRKANGYVNYDNDIVTAKDISASEYSTKENKNLQGEELNFDVPPDGIGYYIVIPNSLETYKFSTADKNYAKLSRYEDSNALSANIYIPAGGTFVVRSYQMKNHKTQLSTLTITAVGDNENGATLNTEENEVVVNKSGYYKAWVVLNSSSEATSCKAGLEYLSATAPNANPQGKATPRNLPSPVTPSCTLWFRDANGWKTDNPKTYAFVWKDGGDSTWVQMNYVYDGDGGNPMYYGTVPAGTYEKVLFIRGNNYWTVSDPWVNLYNQTEDLLWPNGNNNCFKFTSWNGGAGGKCAGSWEDNSRQIKVGSDSKAEMSWGGDTWTYKISSVAANNTAVTFYKNHSSSALSVTRDDDSSAQLPSVNNFLNGKIRTAGTNLDVYLHTGNSVWINVPDTATATVGETEYPLTYDPAGDSGNGEWSATLSDVADNSTVTISYGGIVQTVTPSGNPSEWWKQNNFIGGQIKGGAETLSIYLHKDRTVWVDCVVDIQCGDGPRHRMLDYPETDPKKEKQLYATGIDLTEGENITIRVNGTAFTYNVDPGSYNNVSSGKKAVKTATSQSAYIKVDSKNLWVEGNKTYKVKVGTAEAVEMHYLSSGTFDGWYGIENQNVSASAVTITLNDTTVTGVTAETTKMPDNNTDGTSILRGGTVSIYYDTKDKLLAVTPIYSIKIGSQDIVATLSSGSIYTAEFLSFDDDVSVDVYVNSTRQTNFTPEVRIDAHNNCYGAAGSLKTENGVTSATTATFNLSAKTVWIDGYSPKYFAKVGDGDYQEMTQSPTNESEYYLDIVGNAGDAVSFRKNASNTGYDAQVSILGPDTQNNLDSNKCIITTVSTAKRLCLNIDTNKVWFAGREINLQFHDAALSTFAYLWNSGDDSIKNAEFPGELMTTVEDNVHTYQYVIGNAPLDRLVLSNGVSQSADIDLSDSQYYANNYIYLKQLDGAGKYGVAVRNEIGCTHLYVYDEGQHFGSTPHAYAWGGGGETMDMPGIPMASIVPGSIWATNVSDEYTDVLFANKVLSNYTQTGNLTISEGTDKIFVTTGKNGTSVSGGWKGPVSGGSTNAYIHVGGQAEGTKMAPGDNVDSNKYIYELGIQAQHGQTLEVTDNGVAITQFDSKMNTLPYLSINGTTITVNLGQAGATARFNFYVTMDGTLSIVMVPDLGNGFYIMPYDNSSVEGFVGAHKMSSKDNSGAMYAGYYADKNQKIYLRSYVDAVDVPYTLDEGVNPELATEVTQIDGCSVIQFMKSSYYTIEVSGGKVKIQEFAVQDFLKVNSLDQYNRSVTKQSDILAQHTSLVLSVKFKPTNPAISMTPIIQATNNASDYIGAAVAFGADPVSPSFDPYTYMRDPARYNYDAETNPNGLKKRGESFSLKDAAFVTDANPDRSYYAYILVDYVYSASLATMPYTYSQNIVFYLKMEQAV